MSSMIVQKNSSPEALAYLDFLQEMKQRVHGAKITVSRSVNKANINLYWDLGCLMVEQQHLLGWGQSVVEKLSIDLCKEFPGTTGFSPRNLWDMKRFYEAYADSEFLRQAVAEIPWGQNLLILQKLKTTEDRQYYIQATSKFGWTRNVLMNQIKANAHASAFIDKAHNFSTALPEHLVEQAQETLKSRYNLEFLGIANRIHERDLERRLLGEIKQFLLELGYGFCFIGSQYRLTLGENEYFLDLLFYHRFLKCLVVVELKTGRFRPEHAGKMDFYLNLLNELERSPDDNPPIGIILCAEKDQIEVEFALKSKANPIGVAEYQLCSRLPNKLAEKFPTSDDWQRLIESIDVEKNNEDS